VAGISIKLAGPNILSCRSNSPLIQFTGCSALLRHELDPLYTFLNISIQQAIASIWYVCLVFQMCSHSYISTCNNLMRTMRKNQYLGISFSCPILYDREKYLEWLIPQPHSYGFWRVLWCLYAKLITMWSCDIITRDRLQNCTTDNIVSLTVELSIGRWQSVVLNANTLR
jgi:hypothetical protein